MLVQSIFCQAIRGIVFTFAATLTHQQGQPKENNCTFSSHAKTKNRQTQIPPRRAGFSKLYRELRRQQLLTLLHWPIFVCDAVLQLALQVPGEAITQRRVHAEDVPVPVLRAAGSSGNSASSCAASVMDTEGKGDKVAKYPLRSIINPPSSEQFREKFKEAGMLGENEAPLTEFAGMFAAPGAIAKAPRVIEGGLNRATAAARRGSTPAMLTTEAVAPDLGQFKSPEWQNYLTKKLITGEGAPVSMSTMGGQKTQKFPGQGLYMNKAGEFETNPMVGVSIPRAGNLSKNQPLLADSEVHFIPRIA